MREMKLVQASPAENEHLDVTGKKSFGNAVALQKMNSLKFYVEVKRKQRTGKLFIDSHPLKTMHVLEGPVAGRVISRVAIAQSWSCHA